MDSLQTYKALSSTIFLWPLRTNPTTPLTSYASLKRAMPPRCWTRHYHFIRGCRANRPVITCSNYRKNGHTTDCIPSGGGIAGKTIEESKCAIEVQTNPLPKKENFFIRVKEASGRALDTVELENTGVDTTTHFFAGIAVDSADSIPDSLDPT